MRPDRVMFPKELMDFIKTKTKEHEGEEASEALRGVTMRHMEDLCGLYMRHFVLGYLCGETGTSMSSTALSKAQVRALQDWINAEKIDEVWMPSNFFVVELKYIVNQLTRSIGDTATSQPEGHAEKTMKEIIADSPMLKTALQLGSVIQKVDEK